MAPPAALRDLALALEAAVAALGSLLFIAWKIYFRGTGTGTDWGGWWERELQELRDRAPDDDAVRGGRTLATPPGPSRGGKGTGVGISPGSPTPGSPIPGAPYRDLSGPNGAGTGQGVGMSSHPRDCPAGEGAGGRDRPCDHQAGEDSGSPAGSLQARGTGGAGSGSLLGSRARIPLEPVRLDAPGYSTRWRPLGTLLKPLLLGWGSPV